MIEMPLMARAVRARSGFWRTLLTHDDSGVYAVEFALLAVPFFGILCAFCEYSYVDFVTQCIVTQVQKAGRIVLTGTAQKDVTATNSEITTASNFITHAVCPSSADLVSPSLFPNLINCNNLILDVRPATSWTGNTTNASGMLGPTASLDYCFGKPSTIVILRVVYLLPAILPSTFTDPTAFLYKSGGVYNHVILGTSVLQTEPYTTSYQTCS